MEFNASLIGQIVTFALLVCFTMKFVWPPFIKILDERAGRIAQGLLAAEKAKRDLENAEKASTAKLREAKKQAADMITQAEKRVNQMIEDAKQEAKAVADRQLKEGRAELALNIAQAKEGLRAQVADLVVLGVQKILQTEIDSGRHAKLLSEIQAQL